MARIHALLAPGEDPLRSFASVVAVASEHRRLVGARLLRDGMVRARWSDGDAAVRRGEHVEAIQVDLGDGHGTLEVEPAEPLPEEGRAFLECVGGALGLAFGAEEARERVVAGRRRLEEILAVVCHDLRSPLGTIFLSLGLIDRALRRAEERRGKNAGAIRGAAEQIDRFIEDLVELRRIECGILALEKNRQDVATLVEEAASTARSPVLARRQLALRAHVAPGLPQIVVDRPRILRTIARLLEHAARSAPRGATLALDVAEAERGSVTFTVLAPSPHVLDEANILAVSGKSPGTGFALAIAVHVVREHGGRVFARAHGGQLRIGFTIPGAAAADESSQLADRAA